MELIGIILLLIGFPTVWLVSEFRGNRPQRVTLGLTCILGSFGIAWFVGSLQQLNYNAWYGGSTGRFIATSIEEIEDGNLDQVLKVWRGLDRQFYPTYENRARYDVLVEQAVDRMTGEVEIEKESEWDATEFTRATWDGYWENDTGFWLMIDTDRSSQLRRSGFDEPITDGLVFSDDYTTLEFDGWTGSHHVLTLLNKYEARHRVINEGEIEPWSVETLHRLIRATATQKAQTMQDKKE